LNYQWLVGMAGLAKAGSSCLYAVKSGQPIAKRSEETP
jgi:hypothetical protein